MVEKAKYEKAESEVVYFRVEDAIIETDEFCGGPNHSGSNASGRYPFGDASGC